MVSYKVSFAHQTAKLVKLFNGFRTDQRMILIMYHFYTIIKFLHGDCNEMILFVGQGLLK